MSRDVLFIIRGCPGIVKERERAGELFGENANGHNAIRIVTRQVA